MRSTIDMGPAEEYHQLIVLGAQGAQSKAKNVCAPRNLAPIPETRLPGPRPKGRNHLWGLS